MRHALTSWPSPASLPSGRRSPSQPRRPIAAARREPGRAAGAEAPGDSEAPAVERPARVDRRAPRGAGRPGEPGRAERQRRRPGRQVRRRQPDRRPCSSRARARGRRSKSPTPWTFSARIWSRTAAATCSAVQAARAGRAAGAMPCRSWPTWRSDRRFPADELQRLRAGAAHHGHSGARRSRNDRPAGVRARRSTAPPTATARHRRARRRRFSRSRWTMCTRSTHRVYRPDNAAFLVVGDVTADRSDAPARERSLAAGDRRAPAPQHATLPTPPHARGTAGLPGRQARRRAVADPHRLGRRPAIDARLLPDPGDEHGARRLVLVAPEPQPAREERLHLRRHVALRHAHVRPDRSSPPPACRPTRQPTRSRSSSTS